MLLLIPERMLAKVRHFVQWWLGELGFLLPLPLRARGAPGTAQAWIEVEEQGFRLLRSNGTLPEERLSIPFGEHDEDHRACGVSESSVLLLPEDQVLHKEVQLPLAVEENLSQVLSFEMDRLTPFRAEQVYYDYRVLERNTSARQLKVALFLSPRAYVDRLLDQLGSRGFSPLQVSLLDQGEVRHINLIPKAQRPRLGRLARSINLLLGLAIIVLMAIWLLLPLYQQQRQIEALQPRLQQARQQAELTRQLRSKLELLEADASFLSEKQRVHPRPLDILNELTSILPDHTWVHQLQIKGNQVLLQGRSAGAASVVQLLEQSPWLGNVRFLSPVTRDPREEAERFHFSVELVRGDQQ